MRLERSGALRWRPCARVRGSVLVAIDARCPRGHRLHSQTSGRVGPRCASSPSVTSTRRALPRAPTRSQATPRASMQSAFRAGPVGAPPNVDGCWAISIAIVERRQGCRDAHKGEIRRHMRASPSLQCKEHRSNTVNNFFVHRIKCRAHLSHQSLTIPRCIYGPIFQARPERPLVEVGPLTVATSLPKCSLSKDRKASRNGARPYLPP